MLLAIYCRYRFNFFQSTITGDGAYYPLQVRSILENFRLALPDMPLYFYFTALIAKVLLLINNSAPNETIILAVKIVDILIPALSAILVYVFSKQLINNQNKSKFTDYLMIAFSVLALPYIVFVSGELQKTAIGIAFVFLYFLLVYRYAEKGNIHIIKIAGLLLLLAFTHFGSFTVVLMFTMIFMLLNIREAIKWFKIQDVKMKVILTLGTFLLFVGILLFDSARFIRLISFPFHVLDAPRILFWIKGVGGGNPILNMYTLLINLLAIIALIVLVRNKDGLSSGAFRFILALILLTLVLASPFLNNELFWRFIIYSFVPVTITYLMLFRLIGKKTFKYITIPIFVLMILHSSRAGLVGHRRPSISQEAYTELQSMKESVKLKSNSVVITRLFLGWWVAWEMNTNVSQDYAITESDFKKYEVFYFLRQVKAKDTSGNNILDTEVEIPLSAEMIYKGENFEFYELSNKEDFKILPHKPPVAIGKISNTSNGRFTISNGELNYEIEYDGSLEDLKNGEMVKVWGALRPFSTKIKAEKISTYKTN